MRKKIRSQHDQRPALAIRHSLLVVLSFLFFAIFLRCAEGASPPPTPTIGDSSLSAPQTESERNYLGLPSNIDRFFLNDVRADIVVVDFFDMYCHVCQMRAPHMNEFYKLVQSRNLSGRVKILGVGVGDTVKEVTVFKEKFELPFPVFPDRSGSFSKQFGKIKVPNVIVFKKRLGHFEVVYQDASLPDNPEHFLATVLHYATTRVSLPAGDTTECIEDGTTKRCPIVVAGQLGTKSKPKSSPSKQPQHETGE